MLKIYCENYGVLRLILQLDLLLQREWMTSTEVSLDECNADGLKN